MQLTSSPIFSSLCIVDCSGLSLGFLQRAWLRFLSSRDIMYCIDFSDWSNARLSPARRDSQYPDCHLLPPLYVFALFTLNRLDKTFCTGPCHKKSQYFCSRMPSTYPHVPLCERPYDPIHPSPFPARCRYFLSLKPMFHCTQG